MYVATSQQLKRYDLSLLDEGYSIEQLVDKASDCLFKHFQTYQKIMIVSGPGNNGADGISLGIKLFQTGKKVSIYLVGHLDKLSKANRYYLNQAYDLNMDVIHIDDQNIDFFDDHINDFEVVVDALFGFGLNSDLRGHALSVVNMINSHYDIDVISIDIPTGLNSDTGKPYNSCICAYKTITLTALKLAFLNTDSQMYTGDVVLELLDVKNLHEDLSLAKVVDEKWAKYHLKSRVFDGHKGTYGKIWHITGCQHYIGAAL